MGVTLARELPHGIHVQKPPIEAAGFFRTHHDFRGHIVADQRSEAVNVGQYVLGAKDGSYVSIRLVNDVFPVTSVSQQTVEYLRYVTVSSEHEGECV